MKNRLSIILGAVAVAILAVLLGVFLNMRGKQDAPSESENSVSSDVDVSAEESSYNDDWTSLYDTSVID